MLCCLQRLGCAIVQALVEDCALQRVASYPCRIWQQQGLQGLLTQSAAFHGSRAIAHGTALLLLLYTCLPFVSDGESCAAQQTSGAALASEYLAGALPSAGHADQSALRNVSFQTYCVLGGCLRELQLAAGVGQYSRGGGSPFAVRTAVDSVYLKGLIRICMGDARSM